jgi:type 1 glutamine amidotransferase
LRSLLQPRSRSPRFRAPPSRRTPPRHPLNAAFGGKGFSILDEGYEFKAPYSREKVRVLLNIDLGKTDNRGKRADKDYAFGWIHEYGTGRVFYSAIGHFPELYMNPAILQHYLDGIQYAIGDLKADATPSAKVNK